MTKAEKAKSYQQFCGAARALDRVGERWTLLIVRNLLLGPRRYSDLLAELPGITTNLLAKRLRRMRALGLVVEVRSAPPVSVRAYQLTPLGAALEPVVIELGRWGWRFMDKPRPGDVLNVGWALLALKRRYRGGLAACVGFNIDDRRFELTFDAHRLIVLERQAVRPDVVLSGSLHAFQDWLRRGAAPLDLAATGKLVVEGDATMVPALAAALGPPEVAGEGLPDARAVAV